MKKISPSVKYNPQDKARQVTEKGKGDEERSPFEIDRSRVIHSAAFRRLQGKTQVFAPREGDFFRTRLTHSLEVAQVAKGIALRCNADTDLAETAALIHDLGHPPFGHAGGEELKTLMEDFGGFEANAQNLRLLTKLEKKAANHQGLNLTRATIDAQLKYKILFPKDKKKFIYAEDKDLADWAGINSFPSSDSQALECQIMDWADEVSYAVHDLEDGIHAGFIDTRTLAKSQLSQSILQAGNIQTKATRLNLSSRKVEELWESLSKDIGGPLRKMEFDATHQEARALRKTLTSQLIGKYIHATKRTLRTGAQGVVKSERYLYEVSIEPEIRLEVSLLNQLIWKTIIEIPQVFTLESKARYLLAKIFFRLMQEDGHKLLPSDWQELILDPNNEHEKARVVCDYISGMTDTYAQNLYSRLYLPDEGSVYTVM
ncbi:MAG: dNTP triphosphohydrolase [Chloroflexi bacterium]|nr:dNTP triphosphohydrolase [Chloroflexota bacterium]